MPPVLKGKINGVWTPITSPPGMLWKGEWVDTSDYAVDDVVTYQSGLFVCTSAQSGGVGTIPPVGNPGFWAPMNNEVFVSAEEPPAYAQVQMWYDTDAVSPDTVWPEEVHVGPAEPVEPTVELWFDADEPVAVNNEVTIATVEPTDTTELWYNPAGIPPATGNVPPGGVTGNPLLKLSDVDQHVAWGTGDVVLNDDGKGYVLRGGGGLIKRVGSGVALRKDTTNIQPAVMNYDGSSATQIITANGVAPMTAALAFGTFLGKKVKMYAETFGFGMESGALVAYVPVANKFAVRQDSTTGTEWFAVNNTAAYYKNSVLLTQTAGDARYGRKGGQCYTNAGFKGPWDGVSASATWTINLMGGSYVFILTVSGTVGTNNVEGTVLMKVDGTTEVTVTNYFNSANQHHNFVGTGAGSYGAGNHTFSIVNSTNMQSDSFDRATITIIEV